MEEEEYYQVPGLSFNSKRRKNPFSLDGMMNSFDMGGDQLSPFKGKSAAGGMKGPSAGMGLVGAAAGAIGSMLPEPKRNSNFMDSAYGRKAFGTRNSVDKGLQTGEKVLGAIPLPITQIISGFSKLGRAVGKQTTNEYGIYKSKGAAVVDNVLNPTTAITRGVGVVKDIFDGGKFNAKSALNFATLGVLGESSEQAKAKKMKRLFDAANQVTTLEKNAEVGRQISDSIPRYQAPMYGRKGLKIRSKFSM